MTNEVKNNFLCHMPLTNEALHNLQQKGYKYVQVQGYTLDHHPEYVEPHYLMLVPIKSLSANREKMDIYEDINSDLIKEWAKAGSNDNRLEIFLADRK
ncbi:MAG: hypothetical protein WAT20_15860 [Ferruginibacter sp.]|nr:hypothetical protein [Chitinophagaceae bacterium]